MGVWSRQGVNASGHESVSLCKIMVLWICPTEPGSEIKGGKKYPVKYLKCLSVKRVKIYVAHSHLFHIVCACRLTLVCCLL